MRASDFRDALFLSWRGATVPDSTWRPYVISDPVPVGWTWKVLLASLYSTFPANEGVFLFAIPPQLARVIQNRAVGPADGTFFAPTTGGGLHNEPPLKGAVLVSEGGKDSAFPNEIGSGNGGLSLVDSVNVLNSRRDGRNSFVLDTGWALLGYQTSNGGGGTGNLVLSVMLIPYNACDCAGVQPVSVPNVPASGVFDIGESYQAAA